MSGESINYLGGQMKKSIFRQIDRFELLSCYVFCFCFNTIFDYFKSLSIDSYFLYDFLKQLYDYQTLIVLLISFIVVISHYQIVSRKKVEVHCRIIVGDTIWSAVLRYFVECLILLAVPKSKIQSTDKKAVSAFETPFSFLCDFLSDKP